MIKCKCGMMIEYNMKNYCQTCVILDLKDKNKKLLECEAILRDLVTTKECKRTWVDEMQATIEVVLAELGGSDE